MTNITTLIEKYQGLIKAETDYLASPEGQSSPEYQRIFATQKAFFYQGFVDELEKVDNWIDVNDNLPAEGKNVLVLGEQSGMNPQMGGAYVSISKRVWLPKIKIQSVSAHVDENDFAMMQYVTHWQPLPTRPTI